MNERIRELAEQAGVKMNAYGSPITASLASNFDELAELIVQECVRVCLAQRDPANLNYKPSERFAEAVKQHFGVEE
jgi:hypothetical protein